MNHGRIPTLTPGAIRERHDAETFEHGERDQRDGRVTRIREVPTAHGIAITGTVDGGTPHEVYVTVESDSADPVIESDCSCEIGLDCRHVVAVLLEYAERGAAAVPERRAEEASVRRMSMLATSPTAPAAPLANVRAQLLFVLDVVAAANPGGASDGLGANLNRPGEGAAGRDRTESPHAPSGLRVALVEAHVREDGRYARHGPMPLRRVLDAYRPPHVLPADVELVRRLVADAAAGHVGEDAVIWSSGPATVLEALLATGRCHWQTVGAKLARGEARKARPEWRLAADGSQEIDWRLEPAADHVLALEPPWYLDVERGTCGPVDSGFPAALALRLAAAPRIEPEEAARIAHTLAATAPTLPRPVPLPVVDVAPVAPTPCLVLHADRAAAYARLRFRYDTFTIEAGDTRRALTRSSGEHVERLARDPDAEAAARSRLRAAGLAESAPSARCADEYVDFVPAERDTSAGWVRFLTQARPTLEAEGWNVVFTEAFPYRLVRDESWYGEVRRAETGDWFSLDLGVIVDGERLPLLPLLKGWLADGARPADALEPGDSIEVALPDGRRLILQGERIAAILATLVELYDADAELDGDSRLRLSRWRAMALEAPDGIEWQGADDVRAAAARLRAAGGLERVPVPRGFRAELRDYQRVGLDWLQFLRAHGLAGVLADDMGLGKTVQVLAHLLLENEAGRADRPSLVVAPTSLLANWRREAAAFAPSLRVVTWHGPERRAGLGRRRLDDCDIVLTTYTVLARDAEVLAARPFHFVVLDEAQYVKNARTQAARAARELNARHRLCLTGTPLENHLGEAWSLFDFLLPGLLGTERQFARLFRVPIEKEGNADRRRQLQRRVAPFLLRRRKDDVLAELPPKSEILRTVELEGGQRDLYESIRLAMHREVRDAIAACGLGRSRIVVLDALLKLRQVCCDPRLVDLVEARRVRESAKLELLMTLLPDMIEEGRRVLLFSQFTSMLELIESALQEAGIAYVKLTGATRNRAEPVDRFQRGDIPLFLISLKAGGTGLNLTAADTVIHYDPWWNPAVEAQAEDRAHRIGQHRPVFVYRLVAQGTVEERMLELKERKRALAEGLLGGAGSIAALSAEDVDALLAPIE